MEALVADVQELKATIKQHEQRIRQLESLAADQQTPEVTTEPGAHAHHDDDSDDDSDSDERDDDAAAVDTEAAHA